MCSRFDVWFSIVEVNTITKCQCTEFPSKVAFCSVRNKFWILPVEALQLKAQFRPKRKDVKHRLCAIKDMTFAVQTRILRTVAIASYSHFFKSRFKVILF